MINCPLCKKVMLDPRILPCCHSFCLSCLQEKCDDKGISKCPKCDQQFDIPNEGLKELRKNVFLGRLNELSVQLGSNCKTVKVKKNKYQQCHLHMKPMDLYCRECKCVICIGCLHANHNTHQVTQFEDHFETIKNKLKNHSFCSKNQLKSLDQSYEDLRSVVLSSIETTAIVKKQIKSKTAELKKNIDAMEAAMCNEAESKLAVFLSKANHAINELNRLKNNLEEKLITQNNLLNNVSFKNCLEVSTEDFNNFSIPSFDMNFSLSFEPSDQYENHFTSEVVGQIISGGQAPILCSTTDVDNEPKSIATDGFNVYAIYDNSNEISVFSSVKLQQGSCSTLNQDAIFCSIAVGPDCLYFSALDSNGPFVVSVSLKTFKSSILGKREKMVKLSKYGIEESESTSITMSVTEDFEVLLNCRTKLALLTSTRDPKIIDLPQRANFCEHAIKIGNNLYIMCQWSKEEAVCIIDDKGTVVKSYRPSDPNLIIKGSYHMEIDKLKNIYVADYAARRIVVLDKDLNYLFSFSVDGHPKVLCCDVNRNVLYILYSNQRKISVYQL